MLRILVKPKANSQQIFLYPDFTVAIIWHDELPLLIDNCLYFLFNARDPKQLSSTIVSGRIVSELFKNKQLYACEVERLAADLCTIVHDDASCVYKRGNILYPFSAEYDDYTFRYQATWLFLAEIIDNTTLALDNNGTPLNLSIQKNNLMFALSALMQQEFAQTEKGQLFSVSANFLEEKIMKGLQIFNWLNEPEMAKLRELVKLYPPERDGRIKPEYIFKESTTHKCYYGIKDYSIVDLYQAYLAQQYHANGSGCLVNQQYASCLTPENIYGQLTFPAAAQPTRYESAPEQAVTIVNGVTYQVPSNIRVHVYEKVEDFHGIPAAMAAPQSSVYTKYTPPALQAPAAAGLYTAYQPTTYAAPQLVVVDSVDYQPPADALNPHEGKWMFTVLTDLLGNKLLPLASLGTGQYQLGGFQLPLSKMIVGSRETLRLEHARVIAALQIFLVISIHQAGKHYEPQLLKNAPYSLYYVNIPDILQKIFRILCECKLYKVGSALRRQFSYFTTPMPTTIFPSVIRTDIEAGVFLHPTVMIARQALFYSVNVATLRAEILRGENGRQFYQEYIDFMRTHLPLIGAKLIGSEFIQQYLKELK
jgi:hypothetical protein